MKSTIAARSLVLRPTLHVSLAVAWMSMPAAGQVESLGGVLNADVQAVAASRDGAAIFGTAEYASGLKLAVEWIDGGPITLVDPLLSFHHDVIGVSEDGLALAGFRETSATGNTASACLWDRASDQRIDLGFLPGHNFSYSRAISGDGKVIAGMSSGPDLPIDGWRWDAVQGVQPIGSLGGGQTHVSAVSRDGSVVVGGSTPGWPSWAPGTRAFIWRASTGMVRVPGLADLHSYSDDVADGGRTVVGVTLDPAFTSHAFYYREGSGTQEMRLGGGIYNSPGMVISGDGTTVAGTVYFAGTGTRGFVWRTDGTFTLIDPVAWASPVSISQNGDVVSGWYNPPSGGILQAFRWTEATGFEVLPEPSGGTEWSLGLQVTRDGSAIVGTAATPGSAFQGALWRTNQTIGTGYCDATVPNSAGRLGDLHLSGTNWIAAQGLRITATGLPAAKLGIFLLGTEPGFVASLPSSQGSLCLGGLLGRFVGPGQVQQSNAAGEMTLVVDPAMLPGPGGLFPAVFGQQLYFQGWYRDANPTPTSNLTSAASVRFY